MKGLVDEEEEDIVGSRGRVKLMGKESKGHATLYPSKKTLNPGCGVETASPVRSPSHHISAIITASGRTMEASGISGKGYKW